MVTSQITFCLGVCNFFNRFLGKDVAMVIAAQFALESDYGGSNLAVTFHNYCGMKKPTKRIFLGIGECSNGFAHYFDFENCCYDYLYWIFTHKDFPRRDVTSDMYLDYLVKWKYCPEKTYIDKINSIYKQLKFHLS